MSFVMATLERLKLRRTMSKDSVLNGVPLSLFEQWRAEWVPGDLTLWDYLNHKGTPTLAVAFTDLFWPRFVEARGCVFMAENFPGFNLDEWWEHLQGDRARLEALVNTVHLYDV